MDYLPIFVATDAHRIVVAGEGQLAEAKCRAVLKTAAAVTLFSEAPTEAMREWADQLQLTLETRPCTAADLEGVRLVYAASDNEAANRQLAEWARQAGAWVNVLDEPEVLAAEWERKNAVPVAEDYYDEIWVYGLRSVYDPTQGLELSQDARARMHWTGYLRRDLSQGGEPPQQP